MAQTRRGLRTAGGQIAKRGYTVGHGTATADEFVALLRGAGIEAIADVRTAPGSRRNPQFGSGEMRSWLADAGIGYHHYKALGGWRKPRADSPNLALRNAAFRGYADYMLTDAFAAAVDELLGQMQAHVTAVMCSESVWWRCHRRLLADYLVLVRGWEILDLMHDGRALPHVLTAGVRLQGRYVYYDAAA